MRGWKIYSTITLHLRWDVEKETNLIRVSVHWLLAQGICEVVKYLKFLLCGLVGDISS